MQNSFSWLIEKVSKILLIFTAVLLLPLLTRLLLGLDFSYGYLLSLFELRAFSNLTGLLLFVGAGLPIVMGFIFKGFAPWSFVFLLGGIIFGLIYIHLYYDIPLAPGYNIPVFDVYVFLGHACLCFLGTPVAIIVIGIEVFCRSVVKFYPKIKAQNQGLSQ